MIEFVVAIFLLSGLIKPSFMLMGVQLPFDYVYLCIPYMFLYFVMKLRYIEKSVFVKSHEIRQVFVWFILFTLFAISSGMYSLSSEYYMIKLMYVVQNLLTVGMVFVLSPDQIKKVLRSIVYLTLLCGVIFIFFYSNQYTNYSEGNVEKGDSGLELYLTLGLITGISIFLLLYLKDDFKYFKIFALLLGVILLSTSARGPIVFLIACIIMYLLLLKKPGKVLVILLSFLVTLIICLQFFPENIYVERFETRFGNLISPENSSNAFSVRDQLYDKANEMVISRPLIGFGLASFPVYSTGMDIRSYPHNFAMEIISELGLVGFTLFLLVVLKSLRVFYKKNEFLPFFLILYLLLNFAKGHSIFEVKFFYFFIFCFIALSRSIRIEYGK